MKKNLKILTGLYIIQFIFLFIFSLIQGFLLFFIIFYSIITPFNANIINRQNKEGRYIFYQIDKYKKELENQFGSKLKSELTEISYYILGNRRLFNYLFIDIFNASLKYRKLYYANGWKQNYKSSKKALEKYSDIFWKIYEGQFNFLITYLITLIVIKKQYYLDIIDCLKNPNKSLKTTRRAFEKMGLNIILRLNGSKNLKLYSDNKKNLFSLIECRKNTPKDKNLFSYKNKVIKILKKFKPDSKIVKYLNSMTLDDWKDIKIYKVFFMGCLNYNMNQKFNFLKYNEFDFYDWVEKKFRDKSIHHLNLSNVEMEDKTCGKKIIKGKFKNTCLHIRNYWDAYCKIKALCLFLESELFSSDIYSDKPLMASEKWYIDDIMDFFKNKNHSLPR